MQTSLIRILRSRLFWGLVVVLIIAWLAYSLVANSKFKVTGTQPSVANFGAIVQEFDIKFNKSLSSAGLSVSAQPNIIKTQKVNGKTLELSLSSLEVGKNYTITLNAISSTKGDKLTDRVFKFKTKNLAYKDLSRADQQLVLKYQATNKPAQFSLDYGNLNILINYGLTSAQVNNLEQIIAKFIETTNQSVSKLNIDASSIMSGPRDRNNPPPTFTVYFNISFDKTPYKATIDYSGLTGVHLVLAKPDNSATVFDSNSVTGE